MSMKKTIYTDAHEVALVAASDAIATLSVSIAKKGKASWVLAGGSSPIQAYEIIVSTYADSIDWSKVTILIGDERCVPLNHEDSNWGKITKILFSNELISASNRLTPCAELGAVRGASLYSQEIRKSLLDAGGELSIDLLWLGVGEDGHTLSLFPGQLELDDNSDIFIPVYNSPKPPSNRISLSLNSAVRARKIVIFAVGANKTDAIFRVENDTDSVPIGALASKADSLGAEVLWLLDEAVNANV